MIISDWLKGPTNQKDFENSDKNWKRRIWWRRFWWNNYDSGGVSSRFSLSDSSTNQRRPHETHFWAQRKSSLWISFEYRNSNSGSIQPKCSWRSKVRSKFSNKIVHQSEASILRIGFLSQKKSKIVHIEIVKKFDISSWEVIEHQHSFSVPIRVVFKYVKMSENYF